MRGLSTFHFVPLSDSNTSTTHDAILMWETLIYGSSTSSIKYTYNLCHYQGVLPIKDWIKSKENVSQYTALVFTLFGELHHLGNLLLNLPCFFDHHFAVLGWRAHHKLQSPLAFIYFLNPYIMVLL